MDLKLFNPVFSYKPHGLMYRKTHCDRLQIQLPPVQRQVKSWKEECLYVASTIYKNNTGKKKKSIFLFLSGGIDSGAIALCLKEIEIKFQPIILKFVNNLNKHDVQYALSLCDEINMDPKILIIDPLHIWKEKGLSFAQKVQCCSPQLILPLIVSSRFNGFFIFGGGDPYFKWCQKTLKWFWEEEEKFYSASKYFFQTNFLACTNFFSANSEIILAQLKDPLTQSLLKNPGNHYDFMKYKSALYNKHFNLSFREKYTGFEKLKKEDRLYRKLFSLNSLSRNQILRIPVDTLIEKLSQKSRVILQ